MTSPDQTGGQPYRPGGGSGEPPVDGSGEPPTGDAGEPPTGGHRPVEPVPQAWDWAIDPPPPEGPSREPSPDPAAGPNIDEVPDPIPLTGRFPDTIAPGAGPPSPPDWSTPQTRVSTPPLGGYPPPAPPPPTWASGPTGPEGGAGPEAGHAPPGGTVKVPEFVRPTDRRWWFVLGLVAAVLSCCCVAAAVVALVWGPGFYNGLRDRAPRVVGLNQPARDGDLEFQVQRVRCGVTEVGDPLVSQLAVGQFCLVDLAVRNLGRRPVTFQDGLQIAYGPAGQRFGVDSSAGLLANADQLGFLDEINPGNRVTGAVVYDIPPDTRIVRLRLRASATSPGIQVRTG